jgi:hypothetical protein
MAKQPKEPKSPIKPVFFTLDDPEQKELRKHADLMPNFSEWVKERLREDKLIKEQGPLKEPKMDPKELATLVETLLETKLAGRVVATGQEVKSNEIMVDLDQFF